MSNKFISEAEIEELKKKRQDEWEKVRKPDDPIEAPQEQQDSRSLYERLQEQKYKKEAEFEEAHKLKNLMKGLDDEEVAFLELVDKNKMDQETMRQKEEDKELKEYRKAVSSLSQEASENKLKELKKSVLGTPMPQSERKSQKELLSGAIKRKRVSTSPKEDKKPKLDEETPTNTSTNADSNDKVDPKETPETPEPVLKKEAIVTSGFISNTPTYPSSFKCLGILPGVGEYTDSSSDSSTSSDDEFDFTIGTTVKTINSSQCQHSQ